jgi:hypothetical protein
VSVNPVFPVVFNGGQMTDLPEFSGTLNGQELIEVVAGPVDADLAAEGVNYAITSELLAELIIGVFAEPTIITSGATVVSPYVAGAAEGRILFDKTVGAASGVDIGGGVARNNIPIMVRDIKGDADVNNITVTFTGTCDGLASPITINQPYAGYIFNPLPNGNWYLSNA